jgi:hypothetical protein
MFVMLLPLVHGVAVRAEVEHEPSRVTETKPCRMFWRSSENIAVSDPSSHIDKRWSGRCVWGIHQKASALNDGDISNRVRSEDSVPGTYFGKLLRGYFSRDLLPRNIRHIATEKGHISGWGTSAVSEINVQFTNRESFILQRLSSNLAPGHIGTDHSYPCALFQSECVARRFNGLLGSLCLRLKFCDGICKIAIYPLRAAFEIPGRIFHLTGRIDKSIGLSRTVRRNLAHRTEGPPCRNGIGYCRNGDSGGQNKGTLRYWAGRAPRVPPFLCFIGGGGFGRLWPSEPVHIPLFR